MDINAFSRVLRSSGFELFSTRDLAVVFPGRNRQLANLQLHQWVRRGWVKRLKRGLFELAWPDPVVLPDLFIANRLYEPSYVSLETAMFQHGLIPEVAAQVTSVTSATTKRFVNYHGAFSYFSVMPGAFRGYGLAMVERREVRMAEPEKAIVDRIYAATRKGEHFPSLVERWNRGRIRRLDRGKMFRYAELFKSAAGKLKERLRAVS
jgi:predicted transcriptional regulator of viral defense system